MTRADYALATLADVSRARIVAAETRVIDAIGGDDDIACDPVVFRSSGAIIMLAERRWPGHSDDEAAAADTLAVQCLARIARLRSSPHPRGGETATGSGVSSPPDPVVTCGCGRQYTLAQFRALPLGGVVGYRVGGDAWELESRHCSCGSTQSVDVTALGVEAVR